MKAITTFGADQSAANPAMALLPLFVRHDFELNPAGELEHRIAGHLRAVVPPEGWESYAEHWPDCAPIIKAALGKIAPKAAPAKKATRR